VAKPSPEPALSPDLVAVIHGGVAAVVATRSERMVPAITRGWGTEVSAEGQVLDLCVAAPVGSPTRSNLGQHTAIAIGFSPPAIATAVQVKGSVTRVTAPAAEAVERAERHLSAFIATAAEVAPQPELFRRQFAPTEFLSVMISVEEVFDQTPGPGAGRRL